jgi:hypothetical protein
MSSFILRPRITILNKNETSKDYIATYFNDERCMSVEK